MGKPQSAGVFLYGLSYIIVVNLFSNDLLSVGLLTDWSSARQACPATDGLVKSHNCKNFHIYLLLVPIK